MDLTFNFPGKSQYTSDAEYYYFMGAEKKAGHKVHVAPPASLGLQNPQIPDGYVRLVQALQLSRIPHRIARTVERALVMKVGSSTLITIYGQQSNAEKIKSFLPQIAQYLPQGGSPAGQNVNNNSNNHPNDEFVRYRSDI